jgi:hypothetical protein
MHASLQVSPGRVANSLKLNLLLPIIIALVPDATHTNRTRRSAHHFAGRRDFIFLAFYDLEDFFGFAARHAATVAPSHVAIFNRYIMWPYMYSTGT